MSSRNSVPSRRAARWALRKSTPFLPLAFLSLSREIIPSSYPSLLCVTKQVELYLAGSEQTTRLPPRADLYRLRDELGAEVDR
jgi:hypothetical protein